MSKEKFVSIFGLAILAAFSIVVLSFLYQSLTFKPLPVDESVPHLTLLSLTGDHFTLEETKTEKYILIYFTVECGNCIATLRNFNELYYEFISDIKILGISGSKPLKTEKFVSEYNISFPVLLDQYGIVKKEYGVRTVPAIYFIDERLTLRNYRSGHRSLQTDREWILKFLSANYPGTK